MMRTPIVSLSECPRFLPSPSRWSLGVLHSGVLLPKCRYIRLPSTAILLHRRAFHASPSHRILETCYGLTHTVLTCLHSSIGVSWSVTLPLTALIVRSVVLGPLYIVSHNFTQRQIAIRPLSEAWKHAIRSRVFHKHAELGPKACQRLVLSRYSRKLGDINKTHGTQPWKGFLLLLQLPVFLVVIETIRKMSGTHAGIIGMLTPGLTQAEPAAPPAGLLEPHSAPHEEVEPPAAFFEDSTLTDLAAPLSIVPVEHSLATEGMLWFPDLLAPDPLLILPFALSASLFLNLYYHSRVLAIANPSRFQRRVNKALQMLALSVGPATLQLPSAILLYWISSSFLALGQSMLLQWYLPNAPVITPCKKNGKPVSPGGGGARL